MRHILISILQSAGAVFLLFLAGVDLSRAQTVNVWLTTDDQSKKLQQQAAVSFSPASGGANPIVVDEPNLPNRWRDLEHSFTDTTGYALNELATASARNAAMTNCSRALAAASA